MVKICFDKNSIFSNNEDFVLNHKDNNCCLYRYENIEHFKTNVRNVRLAFSKMTNWEDHLERAFLNCEKGRGYKVNDVACLCFSTNGVKNSAAAWKTHKKNGSEKLVQIKIDFDKFVKALEKIDIGQNISVYVRKVLYVDEECLKNSAKKILSRTIFTDSDYIDLLSFKRQDFEYEGEVRVFILGKNLDFDLKLNANLLFAKLDKTILESIEKISLEPYTAEKVDLDNVPARQDDSEVLDIIDFAKQNISPNIEESRFVQRKRLYEKGPTLKELGLAAI